MPVAARSRLLATIVVAGLAGWQATRSVIDLAAEGLAPPGGFRFGDDAELARLALGKDAAIYRGLLEHVPENAIVLVDLDMAKLPEEALEHRLAQALSLRNLAWPRRFVAVTDASRPAVARQLTLRPSFLLDLTPRPTAPPGHERIAGSDTAVLYRRPAGGG